MTEIFPAHLKSIYPEDLYYFSEEIKKLSGSANIEVNLSGDNDKILFTGENKKNILILIIDGINSRSGLDNYPFLKKILQSVFLKEEDIALVNCKAAIPVSQIKNNISFNTALIFSIDTYHIEGDSSCEKYSPHSINDTLYLLCDSLENLEQDVEKKKTLWKALKKIFN